MMTRHQRELAGSPTRDVAFEIDTWHRSLASLAENGYADTHPAVVRMRADLADCTAELERRERGGREGRVLTDIRRPTDGDDNI